MSDLNCGSWAGWITGKPKVFLTQGNIKRTQFILACHRSVKDPLQESGWGERIDRFSVGAWGSVAGKIKRLKPGAYITLTGRLQTLEYGYDRKVEVDVRNFTIPLTSFEIILDSFNQVIRDRENDEANLESQSSNLMDDQLPFSLF